MRRLQLEILEVIRDKCRDLGYRAEITVAGGHFTLHIAALRPTSNKLVRDGRRYLCWVSQNRIFVRGDDMIHWIVPLGDPDAFEKVDGRLAQLASAPP